MKPLELISICYNNRGQERSYIFLPLKFLGSFLSHAFSVKWSSCPCARQSYRLMLLALSGIAGTKDTTAFARLWLHGFRTPGSLLRSKRQACCLSGRRIADVWADRRGLHGTAASDIVVISGLRAGAVFAESARSGSAAIEAYEVRKRTYLPIEQYWSAEGFRFFPLMVDACGRGRDPSCSVR